MKTKKCKAFLALLLALCLALPAGMTALAEDPVSDEPLEVIADGTEESKQVGAVEVNNESPAVLAKASEGGTATAKAGSAISNASASAAASMRRMVVRVIAIALHFISSSYTTRFCTNLQGIMALGKG